MICYHGSDTIVDLPKILDAKRPLADDRVYRVVVEYENGDMDRETALKNLKTESLCDQILFHTEKSLEYLKYIDTEVI